MAHVDRAAFLADWLDVLFVHFRVDSQRLQRAVPMELDRFGGEAYVSLVAFTQHRLRFAVGGRMSEWLSRPLAQHEFLNVRTYVRHGGVRGIFFVAEWIPNRLATLIGPRTHGLPYRLGRLRYRRMRREVVAREGRLTLRASAPRRLLAPCAAGSLEEFLLERYVAFTSRDGVTRRFDVDHLPWPQSAVGVDLTDQTLLRASGEWCRSAQLVAAHWSPGVRDVAIGAPRRVEGHRSAKPPSTGQRVIASATSDQ